MRPVKLITRIAKKIKQTRTPPFIFSFSFFRKGCDPITALHRRLFILSCRHPLSLILNFIAWIRWLTYYTWKSSYQTCLSKTKAELKDYGLTHPVLFTKLVKLGLLYAIPPHYYFKYKFHQPEKAKQILHYIYKQQLPYFHAYSNRDFQAYQQASKLINDKYRFSLLLKEAGIPTVLGEPIDTRRLKEDFSRLFQQKKLFCKPNNASQSQDAFLIDYDPTHNRYQIVPIQGKSLTCMSEIKAYLKSIISRHDMLLLQPEIVDHPEIKKISRQQAATTIRIITAKSADTELAHTELLYIQLEIPLEKQAVTARQYYKILPLDLNTLEVDTTFKTKSWCPKENDVVLSPHLKSLIRLSTAYCLQAHKLIRLKSISFDVILSEQGPVILEANYNWSVEMLYHIIPEPPLNNDDTHPAARWIASMTDTHYKHEP